MRLHDRGIVIGAVLLAMAVRLALMAPLRESYYQSGLSVMFDDAAHSLTHREGLVSHPKPWPMFALEQLRQGKVLDGEVLRAMPHDRGPGYPFLAYMPGYPVALAAVYQVTGQERWAVMQVLQVLMDASTCALVFWLGVQWFSRRVGAAAAVAYAVYLPAARLSFVPLPDALMPCLVTAGVASWVRLQQRPGWAWAAVCGAVWGLATLVRPDVLLLPAALAGIWAWQEGRRAKMYAAACLCAFGLALSPWIIRNALVFGTPMVTKPGVGINLIELLGKYDPTDRLPGTDNELAAREGNENLYYPDGIARDQRRSAEAMALIRQQPLHYAGLVMRQAPRLFFGNFFGILPGREWAQARATGQTRLGYVLHEPGAAVLRALRRMLNAMEWIVMIGALAGIAALWRAGQRRALGMALLVPAYYVAVHVPMFTVARYFLPAVPCLLLVSVIGWMAVFRIRWAE